MQWRNNENSKMKNNMKKDNVYNFLHPNYLLPINNEYSRAKTAKFEIYITTMRSTSSQQQQQEQQRCIVHTRCKQIWVQKREHAKRNNNNTLLWNKNIFQNSEIDQIAQGL